MKHLIAYYNRQELYNMLLALKPATTPLWGGMKAQQMIEHLISQVVYTNGKKIFIYEGPADEAAIEKHKWIYTDAQIPRNLILGALPDVYEYPDLQTAIDQLMEELAAFDEFFKAPGKLIDHGAYGAMDYKEWVIWHSKHFRHHFTQFGLIPVA